MKVSEQNADADRQRERARTRLRAHRRHHGGGHWHVEVRSSVIICRDCGMRIPRRLDPKYCADCGAGTDRAASRGFAPDGL